MKGVLITFCVLLLAVAMLYMTATIAMYSSQIKGTPTEMSAFERMNMEYDTVSYGINRILANEKVNITIHGRNITFESNLTNSNRYNIDIGRFRQFVTGFSSTNLSVNLTGMEQPAVFLKPHNTVIEYSTGKINFEPENNSLSSGK